MGGEEHSGGTETFRGVVFPWQCDSMGHLSVQHQMPLLDNAVYHLLGELGPIKSREGDARLGWADVSHNIQYLREMIAGDLLVLRSGIISVGTSSLRHRTIMHRRSDGAACTILEGVTVRFDLDVRKARPIPQIMREKASRLIPPALPDQR